MAERERQAVATRDAEDQPGLTLDSAPPEPPPLGARAGLVATLRWGWRQLTSMRTALVLLFLLALAAVPGSLVPQRSANDGQVTRYFAEHPTLAPLLDKVSAFDVFTSPWFAAIYLLLVASVVGCVVPRTRAHLALLRARPPAAPRNLDRLPFSARADVDATPDEAVGAAYRLLRDRRFRVDRTEGERPSVAAEKGYLRETGNLAFHVALLVLLVAVALGSLFGFKGNVIVTEGDAFANTVISYDSFHPGRLFQDHDLAPFTIGLDRFAASYQTQGPERGSPEQFDAYLHYTEHPGALPRRYDLRVNAPLSVGGAKVYLLGHGYAPELTVRDGDGRVVSSGPVTFVPENSSTFLSRGVVKVPSTEPQLGFQMFFLPTFAMTGQGPVSAYPAPLDPVVLVIAYRGDLGLGSGVPQSVYSLETSRMTQVKLPAKSQALRPGQRAELPGGLGSIEFTGVRQYAALQVNRDPGKGLALGSVVAAIGALLLSLFVRRRRMWVRATVSEGGRTVVELGGLARGDGGGGSRGEFDGFVAALRAELGETDSEPVAAGSREE